jgi:hypothetical protein
MICLSHLSSGFYFLSFLHSAIRIAYNPR